MAAKRTGVWTLTNMLINLCRAIVKFRPILMAISANSPALATALVAVETACEALRLALEPYANPEY
jgi:hypothetical protein